MTKYRLTAGSFKDLKRDKDGKAVRTEYKKGDILELSDEQAAKLVGCVELVIPEAPKAEAAKTDTTTGAKK